MFEELLKVKNWDAETNGKFFDELNDYFDEDKCQYTADIAKELMNRGGDMNITSAETLLIYATQHYFNVEDSNCKAAVYYRLGVLYETKKCDYAKAYTCYEKYALNNTVNEGSHAILMRAMLLKDDFRYSDELDRELTRSFGEPDLCLRSDRLYETIAEYLVAQYYKKDDLCEKYKRQIKAIIKADEIFIPDMFFRKDDFRDVLEVPQKVFDFAATL